MKINFNTNALRMALGAAWKAVEAARTADKARNTLELERQRYGLSEENLRYREKLGKINDTEKTAVSSAKSAFKAHSEAVRDSVVKSAFPSGENIKEASVKDDIWILTEKYIKYPEELEELRRKYSAPTTPVMLRVIERYAAENFPEKAADFAFETDVQRCLNLYAALVQLADEAFEDAYGTAADTLEGFSDPITESADIEAFTSWAERHKEAENSKEN